MDVVTIGEAVYVVIYLTIAVIILLLQVGDRLNNIFTGKLTQADLHPCMVMIIIFFKLQLGNSLEMIDGILVSSF